MDRIHLRYPHLSGYITYMPDSRDRFLGAMLFTGGPVVEGINWYVGPAR